jgi:hypothetical protein
MDCIQLSLFGKTYQEHSVPTEEKISEPCWKNLPALNSQTFQFLDLRVGADGAKPEQSPETDGVWLGDSSTINIGECPNAERESLLSQILEDNVPQKYYLSARACQGILTRASRRGKPLPDILRQAILDVIEQSRKPSMTQEETAMAELVQPYKALGNSIALPQWFWIAQKMKPYLSTNAMLGSLFDGIGGFPLVWQKTYGNGTARWASEIEEFPIAVTKRRFGEE